MLELDDLIVLAFHFKYFTVSELTSGNRCHNYFLLYYRGYHRYPQIHKVSVLNLWYFTAYSAAMQVFFLMLWVKFANFSAFSARRARLRP